MSYCSGVCQMRVVMCYSPVFVSRFVHRVVQGLVLFGLRYSRVMLTICGAITKRLYKPGSDSNN